ncbi:ABC transporter permease [Paraburkholderia edwinii]|uniref:ABC transporter permease n=1 Tax=Paraburkholderia edwinii TaxID=2861782 RepID=UPI001FE8ED9D|nr:iron ABC transporter permease [Paraburkholderia edwinii]
MELQLDVTNTPPRFLKRLDSKWLVVGSAILIVAVLALIPLCFLLWQSFMTPQGADTPSVFTLDNYRIAFGSADSWSAFANSVEFAIGAALVSFVVGSALAWINERTNTPLRRFFSVVTVVPLINPAILFTIAWILLASPKIGVLNVALMHLFDLSHPPFNIYSMGGMIWIDGLQYSPMAFLLMSAAFRGMDPSLEESAIMSGAGLFKTTFSITFRLAVPAIVSTVLILFVRAVESFEVPALIGLPVKIQVLTSSIYEALQQYPTPTGLAASYSTILLLITSAGIFLQSRLLAKGGKFTTVSGKAFRARAIDLGPWRYLTAALFVLYALVIVVLPLLVLLWSSFQKFYAPPSMEALHHLTLDSYRYIFSYPELREAVGNSLILGFSCATGVMLLSSIVCWIVIKTKIRGRWLLDNLASLPMVFPGLVLGLAFMVFFLNVNIGIYGTLSILLIAYITRFMPYGMRYTQTSMVQLSKELEESAEMCGSGWGTTFSRIVLPLLKPGLMAGWIYVFIVSIRELSASILLYSPGSETISVVVWELWQNGQYVELSALSVMFAIGLLALVSLAQWVGSKFGVKSI